MSTTVRPSRRSRLLGLLAGACAALLPVTSHAETPGLLGATVSAKLVEGWRLPDGSHMAGLELDLAPGWKTYWRAPGDAGVPPSFVWRGSRNLDRVEVMWPTPSVFDSGGYRTIGYKDRVILPLRIYPRDAGAAVRLEGEVELGVCQDTCLLTTLDLDGAVDGAGTRTPALAAALADQPYTAREARVGRVSCRIAPAADGLTLTAEIEMPSAGGQEIAVIETPDPMIWVAPAETARRGGTLVARTELVHSAGGAFALERSQLRITVLGQNHAVDIHGCKG
ncbi:protein-disulfide reductase DsbD domain-containing protein [Pseudooceanicola sp. 502str34]